MQHASFFFFFCSETCDICGVLRIIFFVHFMRCKQSFFSKIFNASRHQFMFFSIIHQLCRILKLRCTRLLVASFFQNLRRCSALLTANPLLILSRVGLSHLPQNCSPSSPSPSISIFNLSPVHPSNNNSQPLTHLSPTFSFIVI